MSMRIRTAAAVLCGSFHLYVICIVSEGGTLFLCVRALLEPFIQVRANSYAPIGCTSQDKKNLRGTRSLASVPMIGATAVLEYE